MPRIHVCDAEPFHVKQLAENMRQADIDEIWAASLRVPEDALNRALAHADKAWAVMYDDDVAMMFGVCPLSAISNSGIPWMLGSEIIEKFQVRFLRHCAYYVSKMAEDYDCLVNYVDARNEKAIKWLEWLGFEIHEAKPRGALNYPFHRFEKRVGTCVVLH